MAITAEQSFALGSKAGRDRINQQLRANPQYAAYLQSIGANPNGALSDAQRKQAQTWVEQNIGPIGGLEIDPTGNLNNPHGFAQELKQWGPVAAAAGGIAAPYLLPMLLGSGGAPGAAAIGFDAAPNIASAAGMTNAASLGWTLPGAASTAATGTGGGMGLWGSLLKGINKGSDILGAFGAGSGAYSQGQAQNRGTQLDAQMEMERLLQDRERQAFNEQILAERSNRESGQDAWRRLIAAQHMKSPGPQPMLTPYSVAPRARTGAELQGADAMTQEVMKRLQGGGTITPTPSRAPNIDMGLTKPGIMEKILGIGAPVGTYLGNRNRPIYQVHSNKV